MNPARCDHGFVFKKTDAQQGLFNVASQLPESARARLEN